MSCCGRKSAAWPGDSRATPPGAISGGTAGGISDPARVGVIRLRWRRRVTASVTGPTTGAAYAVSAAAPVITVDPRDARGLLSTGFFERIG